MLCIMFQHNGSHCLPYSDGLPSFALNSLESQIRHVQKEKLRTPEQKEKRKWMFLPSRCHEAQHRKALSLRAAFICMMQLYFIWLKQQNV